MEKSSKNPGKMEKFAGSGIKTQSRFRDPGRSQRRGWGLGNADTKAGWGLGNADMNVNYKHMLKDSRRDSNISKTWVTCNVNGH